MLRTKISVADIFAVAAVLLCAVLLFWQPWASREAGERLVVTTPEGSEEYSLAEEREITLHSNGITLRITISNGGATVTESTCPDGICLASGTVRENGETVVCAPAGVSITVKGGDTDVDFVAG